MTTIVEVTLLILNRDNWYHAGIITEYGGNRTEFFFGPGLTAAIRRAPDTENEHAMIPLPILLVQNYEDVQTVLLAQYGDYAPNNVCWDWTFNKLQELDRLFGGSQWLREQNFVPQVANAHQIHSNLVSRDRWLSFLNSQRNNPIVNNPIVNNAYNYLAGNSTSSIAPPAVILVPIIAAFVVFMIRR